MKLSQSVGNSEETSPRMQDYTKSLSKKYSCINSAKIVRFILQTSSTLSRYQSEEAIYQFPSCFCAVFAFQLACFN